MKKRLNRNHIKSKKIYFKKGKNIIAEDRDLFWKKYNVDGVIKNFAFRFSID